MTKQCYACKTVKATSDFYASPQTKDGLMTYCKECHKAKMKEGHARKAEHNIPVLPPAGSTKMCRHCHVVKPIEEFGANKRMSDGIQNDCKTCANAMVALARSRNPERHRNSSKRWAANNREKARDSRLKSVYGLPIGDYERLLAEQGGGCAICGTTVPGSRTERFHVDHCHDTGEVRGLLCSGCNMGIGQLKHDQARLLSAQAYLDKAKAK